MAEPYENAGDPGAARATWTEALAALDEIGHARAAAVRARIAALRWVAPRTGIRAGG